ncbi:hypothetical protein QCA50_008688 [Cerrena zonata]|uniref:Uncharacterized protein n=1 Tax=Cerrena zonata TaxID=2478898 RepID=A0AAW0G676_9APHY
MHSDYSPRSQFIYSPYSRPAYPNGVANESTHYWGSVRETHWTKAGDTNRTRAHSTVATQPTAPIPVRRPVERSIYGSPHSSPSRRNDYPYPSSGTPSPSSWLPSSYNTRTLPTFSRQQPTLVDLPAPYWEFEVCGVADFSSPTRSTIPQEMTLAPRLHTIPLPPLTP